ncbi:type II toxin-antitoxin system mRNA interferase toxin, RelE/StbE family [Candidatus Daviesbacteria bacterium]|nr:type II toxin-antitoxin system mRNA interferase toxin, RelE/StbE family [Candidatus Daviesbacteria bacterium]
MKKSPGRLELFIINQFHPQLNNHSLTGKYKGNRSINITGDWRAIYSEEKDSVIFELLGTHSQLYR